MKIIRSAFWLGLAIAVIQPYGINLTAQARSVRPAVALDAGHRAVTRHLMNIPCESIQCAGGKVALAVSGGEFNPSQASTMQDSPSLILAPVPRPRLDRAG